MISNTIAQNGGFVKFFLAVTILHNFLKITIVAVIALIERSRDFSNEMAGYHVSTSYLPELWFTLPTNWYSMGTPGVESTSGGNIDGAGNISHQDSSFLPASGIGHRYSRKESLSIVVSWVTE